MGETYDQVQKEIGRVPYKVVRGDNNTPRVDIEGRLLYSQENFCNGTSEDEENS